LLTKIPAMRNTRQTRGEVKYPKIQQFYGNLSVLNTPVDFNLWGYKEGGGGKNAKKNYRTKLTGARW